MQVKIKQAKNNWNSLNPNNKKTMSSLALECGTTRQYLNHINNRYKPKLTLIFDVVFLEDNQKAITKRWNDYLILNIPILNVIEQIRIVLNCQIWELIEI